MNIKAKIKRLFRTSPAEIQYRLQEKLHILIEKKNHQQNVKNYFTDGYNFFDDRFPEAIAFFQSDQIHKLLQDRKYTRLLAPLPDQSKKEQFKEMLPDRFEQSLKRADEFLQNKFRFLGISFQLPDPIPWDADPVSLKPFPGGFYNDVDIFTNQNPGDVKHVWEVNRLQFLIELAKAYFLTGEKKYKVKIDQLVLDWYNKNPYQTGIAWASALEVGVRALALIWTLHFYQASLSPEPQTIRIILKILYWSGLFLNNHLSIYFSPYNHLIGETAALFAVGFLFPCFKNADLWQKKALKILSDQVEKQFHEDGGSVEQATFYHHFTLGFYLQTISLLKHNKQTIPVNILQRVEKALEFSMYMMRPDGTFPYIGDIDDARSIYFSDPTNWNFKAFQCFGAAWFNRPDMKFAAERLQEEAFWMFSPQELTDWEKLPSKAPEQKYLFLKESGYYVFRSGYDANAHFSFMDCGPLAHGVYHDETPSAAHGHADLLSIEIAPFGKSLLIDAGFSNYRGEYDWHKYFRSTAAHNTVTINGKSQAEQVGILKWSFAPEFKLLTTLDQSGMGAVCGEHYGYHRLEGQPTHRRYFVFVQEKFWLVLDYLFARQDASFELQWNWHFNKATEVDSFAEQNALKANQDDVSLQMHWLLPEEKRFNQYLAKGGQRPEQGWISPTYRNRQPAFILSQTLQTNLPMTVPFVLLPENKAIHWQVEKHQAGLSLNCPQTSFEIAHHQNSNSEILLTITTNGTQLKLLKSKPYFQVV